MKKMGLSQMEATTGGCILGLGLVSNFLTLVLPVNLGNNSISNTLTGLLSGFIAGPGTLGIPGVLNLNFLLAC